MSFKYKNNILKNLIKKTLNYFGWKLIKTSIKPQLIKDDVKTEYVKAIMKSNGILHIGAHRGSEAPIYYWFGKDVVWVEANPKIYDDLKMNIYPYPNQKAYNYLITDLDDQIRDFNISNNDGASSSILSFGEAHLNYDGKKFKMVDKIKMKTIKLKSLFEKFKLNKKKYNFWVIDVQGA